MPSVTAAQPCCCDTKGALDTTEGARVAAGVGPPSVARRALLPAILLPLHFCSFILHHKVTALQSKCSQAVATNQTRKQRWQGGPETPLKIRARSLMKRALGHTGVRPSPALLLE